jgi:cephalosporin hydroxylase
MDPITSFTAETNERIKDQGRNLQFKELAHEFVKESITQKYMYNFSWMGRPIIQFPQDIMAMQELIWEIKPDLIIETGIAHGGSIIFSASMLELLGGDGKVIGIDIDIRKHNREEIEKHPMAKRIIMIEGSSISTETVEKVKLLANGKKKIMVILDSNHTHEHVLNELKMYAPFVSIGSYLLVYDTIIENMPKNFDFGDRPWKQGNNPKTAVHEFLKFNKNFVIQKDIENKILISVGPDGYLKRVL